MTLNSGAYLETRSDWMRERRAGVPEIIYSSGKSDAQLVNILESFFQNPEADSPLIFSRLDEGRSVRLSAQFSHLRYDERARVMWAGDARPALAESYKVAIVSGGTSDQGVAEEAACILTLLGHQVERFYDVGVAGLHRILAVKDDIAACHLAICVAGMEGALPSVLSGLTMAPVIAVPTSVGYGAHFEGLAPLLSMLNSCAPGMATVNIDNGVGAALMAHKLISRFVDR